MFLMGVGKEVVRALLHIKTWMLLIILKAQFSSDDRMLRKKRPVSRVEAAVFVLEWLLCD